MKRAVPLSLLLTACAMPPDSARLYPANDEAAKTGIIEAKLTPDYIRGGGGFDIVLPNGALMKGEYAVVREGVSGFGTIFGSVHSGGAGAFGSGFSTGTSMRNANQGVASAFGSDGTRASCEFLHDSSSQRGYGACRLSTGAVYRLQY